MFTDTEKAHTANALHNLMYAAGMTQQQLADRLNVTQPFISSVLAGRYRLGRETAERAAQLFNVDLDVITGPNPAPWRGQGKRQQTGKTSALAPEQGGAK